MIKQIGFDIASMSYGWLNEMAISCLDWCGKPADMETLILMKLKKFHLMGTYSYNWIQVAFFMIYYTEAKSRRYWITGKTFWEKNLIIKLYVG